MPIGAEVIVDEWDAATDKKKQKWSRITWAGQEGWMISEFLREEDEEPAADSWTVIIPGLTKEQAERLCREWGEATMARG